MSSELELSFHHLFGTIISKAAKSLIPSTNLLTSRYKVVKRALGHQFLVSLRAIKW